MTKEQKKEFLQYLKNLRLIQADDFYREGFDIAISALSEELSEDGTLTVHVSDGSKVKRVFVMGDNIFGGLYYPDSAENEGEWIPVKVALPEEGRSVLVCFKSQGGMAQAVSERFNISGEWRWSALGGRKPLAWQPLPEPYKKGE